MTIVDALIALGTKLCGQAVSGETISDVLEDMAAKYTAPSVETLSVSAKTTSKKSS